MAAHMRRDVLRAFKDLHRARKVVFSGDDKILQDSRQKINQEFRKNKSLADSNVIKDLVDHAHAVATELRSSVIQAVEKAPGVFELRIRPETHKLENKPFDPDAVPKNVEMKGCSDDSAPCCGQTVPCCREVKQMETKKN